MRTSNIVQTAIPVDEATVQERPVSIKVLTVGAKQVTQSLYRQLEEEYVIDSKTGKLKGEVWGWVNLHIDCQSPSEHKHVVWEDATNGNRVLKRSRAYPSFSNTYYKHLHDELRMLAEVYLGLLSIADKKIINQTGEKIRLTVKGQKLAVKVNGNIEDLWWYPEALKASFAEVQSTDKYTSGYLVGYRFHADTRQEAIEKLSKAIAELPEKIEQLKKLVSLQVIGTALEHLRVHGYETSYPSYEQVYRRMEELGSEITSIEQEWSRSYQTIENAGQLFIAVSGVWK